MNGAQNRNSQANPLIYRLDSNECCPQAANPAVLEHACRADTAHLIADHLERRKGRGFHGGQYGCRERRFYMGAVVVLMNRTQQAWGEKKVAGAC